MMVESGEANPMAAGKEVRSMKKQVSFGGRGFEKQMSFKGLLLEKQKSFRKKRRDSPGKRGDSAVHLAARAGNLDRLRELVPQSLSEQNINGETPLYVAAEHGNSTLVAHMLAHMDLEAASLPARNGYDPFHIAARLGHLDVIKEMVRVFPNLAMTTDLSNMTALHTAAAQGHIQVVELLLRSDSELAKIARNNGKTPLHSAARAGHTDIVCALLSNDPSAALRTDKKGQTPLHMAAKGSSSAVVLELLGLDPAQASLPDNKGNTALHIAVAKARPDNVRHLLLPPLTNALNKAGETPLDVALRLPSSHALVAALEAAGATKAAGSTQLKLKQTVSAIKHDVESQLQQSRQTGFRVHKIAKRLKKLHISGLNNAINSATIVAVLIATVAFAAIFTVPGQFEEGTGPQEGEAHIAAGGGGAAFMVFFVSDSMALFISLAVVVVQTSVVVIEEQAKRQLVFVINKLMWVACLSISGAFVALAYVVVGEQSRWLAVFATAIGASIMLTTIGSMCYCIVSHRLQESKRRLKSRSRSFSASDSDIRNTDYKRMYAL